MTASIVQSAARTGCIPPKHFDSAQALQAHYRRLMARPAPVVDLGLVRPAPKVEPAPYVQPTVEELLANFRLVCSTEAPARLTLTYILASCCAAFEVPVSDVKSERKTRHLLRARFAYFYLARHLTPKSFPEIGKFLGGRDHTTSIHGMRRCEQIMEVDADYRMAVLALRKHLEMLA